jgi:hypothetical protein
MPLFTQIEQEPGLFDVVLDPGKLAVTQADIGRALGYGEKKIPEHFAEMINGIIARLASMCKIKAGYRMLDVKIPADRNDGLYAGDTFFNLRNIVTMQLRDSERAALFACTIGPDMEKWRRALELDRDEVMALLVDAVASSAVENAVGLLHDHIRMKMLERRMNVTNRFSPGYCGWPVTEQQSLFSRFPKGFCGITLTESSLMIPIKSISGIIGVGATVARKDYPCNRCERNFCLYRTNLPKGR